MSKPKIENILSHTISNCGCLKDNYWEFIVFLDPKDDKIKAKSRKLGKQNDPA